MSRYILPILLLPILITACGTTNPPKLPSIAQGHLGQVVKASSSIAQGRSLLQHAHLILEHIIEINREVLYEAENQNFTQAKRRIYDAAKVYKLKTPSNSASLPGLQETVTKALFHTLQAGRTTDSSRTIQQATPDIRRKANRILEDSVTLGAHIDNALAARSNDALLELAKAIDTAAQQISGRQLIAGGYNLIDLERDLVLMLAKNNEQLVEHDVTSLRNFTLVPGTDQWVFKTSDTAAQLLPPQTQ